RIPPAGRDIGHRHAGDERLRRGACPAAPTRTGRYAGCAHRLGTGCGPPASERRRLRPSPHEAGRSPDAEFAARRRLAQIATSEPPAGRLVIFDAGNVVLGGAAGVGIDPLVDAELRLGFLQALGLEVLR